MSNKTELSVNAIKEGTVIDHIPADSLFKVIHILGLDECSNQITFGTNLESHKFEKKAIIKVSDKFFADDEINKIALVAREAHLNIIKDYEVVEKKEVSIEKEIIGIAKCFNPKCVTNNQNITTRMLLVDDKPLSFKCHYCEKITTEEHLKII